MRVPLIHPTDERQVPDLRAVPVSPRTPKPFRPAYPGVSADVLPGLRAADTSWAALGMRRPVAPQPIVLTDWSARLAADFADIDAGLNRLHRRIPAEQVGLARSFATAVTMLTQPLFAELANFAAELDDDRGAMLADVHAERVLIAALTPLADAVKAGA